MMKLFLSLVIIGSLTTNVFIFAAEEPVKIKKQDGTELMRVEPNGKVMIGQPTTGNSEQLQVKQDARIEGNLAVEGNIGIGTAAVPTEKLEVNGNAVVDGNLTVTGQINGTGFSSFGWSVDNSLTSNYSVTIADSGEMFRFTSATSSNVVVTLPSVDMANNGMVIWIKNESNHVVTVRPSDDDCIWSSAPRCGIELVEPSLICLRYNHSRVTWEAINKAGGMIRIEGLRAYLACDTASVSFYDGNNHYIQINEIANHNIFYTYGVSGISAWICGTTGLAKYGASCLIFNGSGFFQAKDRDDWDIFGSTIENATVSFWVYFNNNADGTNYEVCISQRADDDNYWFICRTPSGQVKLGYEIGGLSQIEQAVGLITGGGGIILLYAGLIRK